MEKHNCIKTVYKPQNTTTQSLTKDTGYTWIIPGYAQEKSPTPSDESTGCACSCVCNVRHNPRCELLLCPGYTLHTMV